MPYIASSSKPSAYGLYDPTKARAGLVAAGVSLALAPKDAGSMSRAAKVAESSVMYNRELHDDERTVANALKKGKTLEEQHIIDEAAAASVKMNKSVPDSDQHKAAVNELVEIGKQHPEVIAALKSKAVEMAKPNAFVYSKTDAFTDRISRYQEPIDRGIGVVTTAQGATLAVVGSGATATNLVTPNPIGAMGYFAVGAGSVMVGSGLEMAMGPHTSQEGAFALASLSQPVPSYMERKALSYVVDAFALGGGKALTTVADKVVKSGSNIMTAGSNTGKVPFKGAASGELANAPNLSSIKPSSLDNPLIANAYGKYSSKATAETAGLGSVSGGKVGAAGDVTKAVKITAAKSEVVASEVASVKVGGKTAKEVVTENPYVTKNYLQEVESVTGLKVHPKQVKLLKEDLKATEYGKISDLEQRAHRAEFNSQRPALRDEWAHETGQKWPVYERDYYNGVGDRIKKAGEPYDGHHITPVSYGGPNKWHNIHPAHFKDEHIPIHGSDSVFRQIFNNVVKK